MGPLAMAFVGAGINRALNPPPKPTFTPPQLGGAPSTQFAPPQRRGLLSQVANPLLEAFMQKPKDATIPNAAPSPYRQGVGEIVTGLGSDIAGGRGLWPTVGSGFRGWGAP